MYYRRTDKDTPMSDWGHAMFTTNIDAINSYGNNLYTYNNNDNAIDITALQEIIVKTWETDKEEGFPGYFTLENEDYWQNLDGNEIYNSFNPQDIVNSADGWDSELVLWIWDRVLDPIDCYAIITYDGAILFDPSLCKLTI